MPVANAWVKSARALAGLPLVREAYAQGRITWEHVAALADVAIPSTERELLGQAVAMSAAHFKRLARSLKQPTELEAQEAIEQRSLSYHWDNAGRFLLLNGKLPDSDGAVVAKALDRLSERVGPDPLTGQYSSINQNNADALVELASTYIDTEADQDRATVVVHLDAQVLKGEPGSAEIEEAGPISVATARRICCDSWTELIVEGPDRKPVGVGRKTRQVPGWLVRQVRRRDVTCRFPGCNRTRWVHCHHLKHWGDGGPTDKDNLTLLCSYHHRLVHEGGWEIRGHPDDCLQFVHPDGRMITGPPPELRPELRDSLFTAFEA
jgi:hypothetical protein